MTMYSGFRLYKNAILFSTMHNIKGTDRSVPLCINFNKIFVKFHRSGQTAHFYVLVKSVHALHLLGSENDGAESYAAFTDFRKEA